MRPKCIGSSKKLSQSSLRTQPSTPSSAIRSLRFDEPAASRYINIRETAAVANVYLQLERRIFQG